MPEGLTLEPSSLLQSRARLEGLRAARSRQGSTVVIMKTYGESTPWIDWLAERYGRQLAGAQIHFSVLRDVTNLRSIDGVQSTSHHFGNITAQLCEVSGPVAKKRFPTLNSFESDGKFDSHLLYSVFELLWWKDCAPRLPRGDVGFAWFVEHDAFFNGDLAQFIQAFVDDGADYVARGLRIAGPQWWLYGHFQPFLDKGLRTFRQEDEVVKNVSPLPEISEGKCRQDISDSTTGLLFAQDHVVRYSARLFRMLASATELGMAGPGEAFKSTLCASGLGLSNGEKCTILDFEPIRTGKFVWTSPVYCWVQVQAEPGRESVFSDDELPCDAEWRDKWVHPVKVDTPKLKSKEC